MLHKRHHVPVSGSIFCITIDSQCGNLNVLSKQYDKVLIKNVQNKCSSIPGLGAELDCANEKLLLCPGPEDDVWK